MSRPELKQKKCYNLIFLDDYILKVEPQNVCFLGDRQTLTKLSNFSFNKKDKNIASEVETHHFKSLVEASIVTCLFQGSFDDCLDKFIVREGFR